MIRSPTARNSCLWLSRETSALQTGNSESIVRRHYLNLHPREDGEKFFRIVPTDNSRDAVFDLSAFVPGTLLKAVV
ncbi:hypothetical protein [Haloferula sp.]|uniref:hypothetical protein n=1 Tax=Haloferula sp. TaxID=2497595 RepID=UPI003C74593F